MSSNEFTPLRQFANRFIETTEEEWQIHQRALVRRFVKKGELLIRAGEVCNHVWFANKGGFRVYVERDGIDYTQYFAFENEYITNYESFLTRQPSACFIQVIEDAELMELNYENMQYCYEQIPAWQKYGRLIGEYVFINTSKRASDLLLKTPEQLYLDLLKDKRRVIDRVPQHQIASYLGIQPESLSRLRKRLAQVPVDK